MSAAKLKALAQRLSNDSRALGRADADDYAAAAHVDRLLRVKQASMQALIDAIDAALPALPAAQNIELAMGLPTVGAAWLDLPGGADMERRKA